MAFLGDSFHLGGSGTNGFMEDPVTHQWHAWSGYWVNGEQETLETTPFAGPLWISAILVEDGDIYLAGNVGRSGTISGSPAYWKNGVINPLLPSDAVVTGIDVSGPDVYVSGNIPAINPMEDLGFNKIAVYWKNGEMVRITNNLYSTATSILIDGTDVYVTGSDVTDLSINLQEAVFWKNGVPHYIPESTEAYSILIDQANTHVICKGNVYWKNGASTVIGDPSKEVITCMALVK
jgi:hypothetical protein